MDGMASVCFELARLEYGEMAKIIDSLVGK